MKSKTEHITPLAAIMDIYKVNEMNEIINVGTQIKYNKSDSNIIRIQRKEGLDEFKHIRFCK